MKYRVKNNNGRDVVSGCGTRASEFNEYGLDGCFETLDINRVFQYVMTLMDYKFGSGSGYSDGPFRAVGIE